MQFHSMEEVILRSEVMKQADTGEPFDMIVVACDRRRGTGGELIKVKGWQKLSTEPGELPDKLLNKIPGRFRKAARAMLKDPNHWLHKTINIYNPMNRALHPIKVHFRLIQFFNGKRVING